MSPTLQRQAFALVTVTSHPPVATARLSYTLKNPLNGSGGATFGARVATNNRRKAERLAGRTLAVQLNRSAGLELGKRNRAVLLTRISPKPFDSDNLAAAFKSIRDGMADFWGVDDGDADVTWVYDWRKGATREHAIEASLWFLAEVTP